MLCHYLWMMRPQRFYSLTVLILDQWPWRVIISQDDGQIFWMICIFLKSIENWGNVRVYSLLFHDRILFLLKLNRKESLTFEYLYHDSTSPSSNIMVSAICMFLRWSLWAFKLLLASNNYLPEKLNKRFSVLSHAILFILIKLNA